MNPDAADSSHRDEYDDELVGLLELVWGDGFLAPGGADSVRHTVAGVELGGSTVLDIGCGVGGADLVLAREMGARVHGVDIETGLVARCRANAERAGLADQVTYERTAPGPLPFADESFDHVFTHAALIHVDDKPAMFAEIHRVLRPGGWLLAYDWLRGPDPYTPEMMRWFELEGLTYNMADLATYRRQLVDAGFIDVATQDGNESYRIVAHREYEQMVGPWRDRLTSMLGTARRDHFVEDWRLLTVVLDQGQLRPAWFRGRKPAR
jgi:phosphoethanolamine N-methyltransferase